MIQRTNVIGKLERSRKRRLTSEGIMNEVQHIFKGVDYKHTRIKSNLKNEISEAENVFNLAQLNADCIYHISNIQKS